MCHRAFEACCAASKMVHISGEVPEYAAESSLPLRVASSKRFVSTAAPGRWTYRTTLPRMKTFLTDDFDMSSQSTFSHRELCAYEVVIINILGGDI